MEGGIIIIMSTNNRVYLIQTNARIIFRQNVTDTLNSIKRIALYYNKFKFPEVSVYVGSYGIDADTKERVKVIWQDDNYKKRHYKKLLSDGNIYCEVFIILKGRGARTVSEKIYKNVKKNGLNPTFPMVISEPTEKEFMNKNYTFYHRRVGEAEE